MNLLIIYNPKAAHGRAANLLAEIRRYCTKQNIDAEIKLTEYKRHGQKITQKADLSKYDGIIAAGGDGTLFEVLNGYFLNQSNRRIPIGVLPVGTGNSFAKDLGLETGEWRKGLDMVLRNTPQKVDVGHFETNGEAYYFLNIIGLGFVTEVMQTSERYKRYGNLSYILAVFLSLFRLQTYTMNMVLDGEPVQKEATLVEISNTRYTARNFLIAPDARFDDGNFDVTLATKLSRLRLIRLFTKLFKGEHTSAPEIEIYKVKDISIDSPTPLLLGMDGELLGSTPVKLKCLPGAIEVFM